MKSFDTLIAAAKRVLVGGNHVALLIGSDHPPYTASDEVAQAFYLPHHQEAYEAWLCWRTIMHLRNALATIEQQPTGVGEDAIIEIMANAATKGMADEFWRNVMRPVCHALIAAGVINGGGK